MPLARGRVMVMVASESDPEDASIALPFLLSSFLGGVSEKFCFLRLSSKKGYLVP